MAGRRQHGLDDHRSEFGQIISEAKHRWLRTAEICKLLRNHRRLTLFYEPANMPESGSLFLYDRKVRFRNDGHRWKKTRDGKAVKEAHETLKDEGVKVLHCYYAHGEENGNFQRRSYWMLKQDLSHIALVHYREVESNRKFFNHVEEIEEVVPYSNETEELAPNPEMQNPISSSFNPCNFQMHSQATDATILKTAQASEFKNPESGACWQTSEGTLPCSFNWPMDQSLHSNREYDITTGFHEEVDAADLLQSIWPCHMDSDIQNDCSTQTNTDTISKRNNTIDGNADHPSVIKPQSDNQQIYLEAKSRWLLPAEICEILQNNKKFHISSEPANMPPGGNWFLYDRKVRFRNDGHRWKKTRDGKAVKEGHEKLKVGSVDVLHCYYAHGEENENFQRRTYWMLEEDLSHIALVHYREVKGKAGKQATKTSTAARSQQPKSTRSPEPEALTVEVESSFLLSVMTDTDWSTASSPLSDLSFADYTESSSPWDNSGTESFMLEKYPSVEIDWAPIVYML